MERPLISLCASANRIEYWMRLYNSLKGNTISWEIIFVGDRKPNFELPSNFKYIYATVKPAQCYQIAFWAAQGELIAWTADDADYNEPSLNCPNCLDIAYEAWKRLDDRFNNDKKSVLSFRPIEDGGDVWKFHHYYGGVENTPTMAPFALIHRDYFVNKLSGYDRRFVSGQSENDVIMRVYEDGGRVEVCLDAKLYVHHRQVHPRDPRTGREDNKFRKWYNKDREILENCWTIGGYGFYEKLKREDVGKQVQISKTRLLPFESFENTLDVYTITQGEKGHWL